VVGREALGGDALYRLAMTVPPVLPPFVYCWLARMLLSGRPEE
jgi:hypothetical protein